MAWHGESVESLYLAVDLIAGALHELLYGVLGLLLGPPCEPVVEDAAFLIPEHHGSVILDRDSDGNGAGTGAVGRWGSSGAEGLGGGADALASVEACSRYTGDHVGAAPPAKCHRGAPGTSGKTQPAATDVEMQTRRKLDASAEPDRHDAPPVMGRYLAGWPIVGDILPECRGYVHERSCAKTYRHRALPLRKPPAPHRRPTPRSV